MKRARNKVDAAAKEMKFRNGTAQEKRRSKQAALELINQTGVGNMSAVAQELGVPRTTLQSWIKDDWDKKGLLPLGQAPSDFRQEELSAQVDSILGKLLRHANERVNDEDELKKVELPKLFTAIGIMIDKKRALDMKSVLEGAGTISIDQLNVWVQSRESTKQLTAVASVSSSSPAPVIEAHFTPDSEGIGEDRPEQD